MTLSQVLKLAAAFGLDLDAVKKIALEQGIPFARQHIINHCDRQMNKAVPKILANLATKAPLDGQQRRDLDGVLFEDWEYLCHESLYLLVKAVLKRGGAVVDGWRDSHVSKVLALVSVEDHSTPEAVVRATLGAELEVTF